MQKIGLLKKNRIIVDPLFPSFLHHHLKALVVYKRREQGINDGTNFFNSPIFSTVKCTYYKSAKYRTIKKICTIIVPFLFTPPMPSNPIYH